MLLSRISDESKRGAKVQREIHQATVKTVGRLERDVHSLQGTLQAVREDVRALHDELRERMLQYHLQLARVGRRAGDGDGEGDSKVRLSGRSVPLSGGRAEDARWAPVGSDGYTGGEDADWEELPACPVCSEQARSIVNPWNKLILTAKAPDASSARYDYGICHGCGVLYATRRPTGARYRFLLEHFGEVTAKRGGTAEIANRVLNPYPLDDSGREELRRLARHGVFVSDHLGLRTREHLAPLLRDRFENSAHADIIGSLLNPRDARVLEVRSRTGTILETLRRTYGARVFAMPIWESQQFLLREVYGIETSDLIDFEAFSIPFEGHFDVIVCNHMFTHMVRPAEFFAELRRKLTPGGHIYLYNEPDDVEFLAGNQSMLATLNPLHLQAFDQRSLMRALAANGFETVFIKGRNLSHLCLARARDTAMAPMTPADQRSRVEKYEAAFARAVLGIDEALRPRVAAHWEASLSRAVASGVAEFDADGRLRLVAR
jgi:SAM-dependent methyltransferase